jgi:hypothetical protein
MRTFTGTKWGIVVLILGWSLLAGCGKKDSGGSSTGGSSANGPSGEASAGAPGTIGGTGDPDAVNAANAEIAKHWVSTPDGWISEFPSHVYIATGKRSDAESYYRQLKELKYDIQPGELSDADKLNGLQFYGRCVNRASPMRVFNDPNEFIGKKWTEWKQSGEGMAAFVVQKKNGQWICDGDSYFVTGTKPSDSTVGQLK